MNEHLKIEHLKLQPMSIGTNNPSRARIHRNGYIQCRSQSTGNYCLSCLDCIRKNLL